MLLLCSQAIVGPHTKRRRSSVGHHNNTISLTLKQTKLRKEVNDNLKVIRVERNLRLQLNEMNTTTKLWQTDKLTIFKYIEVANYEQGTTNALWMNAECTRRNQE